MFETCCVPKLPIMSYAGKWVMTAYRGGCRACRTSQGERYAMNETSNIVALRQPDDVDDPLTMFCALVRGQLLAQAVEIEVETFLATVKDSLPTGAPVSCGMVTARRKRLRPGSARSRSRGRRFGAAGRPVTASGSASARRSCHCGRGAPGAWMRCCRCCTYAASRPRFPGGADGLAGKDAPNLSPAVISRLTAEWQGEYERWQKRDLSARRYVYVWADGVFLQARMEDHGECMLVLIGATPEGKKELIGFQVGVRENTQSWRELLIDVKQRGLQIASEIAVGDGAFGFCKALDEVFPGTRHQRCRVHKTVNVLDKVPLSVQANMKKDLREVYWGRTGRPPRRRSTSSPRNTAPSTAGRSNVWSGIATRCWPSTTSLPSIGITCARRMRWTFDASHPSHLHLLPDT